MMAGNKVVMYEISIGPPLWHGASPVRLAVPSRVSFDNNT